MTGDSKFSRFKVITGSAENTKKIALSVVAQFESFLQSTVNNNIGFKQRMQISKIQFLTHSNPVRQHGKEKHVSYWTIIRGAMDMDMSSWKRSLQA